MKKFLPIWLIAITINIYCQEPVLNFETHAIKNEFNNEMKICKYLNPGNGGENVVWDFSSLETIEDFTGFVKSSYQTVNSEAFPQANTELQEFNNRFYFKVDEKRIEQYGYISMNNNIVVKFEKPFLKMSFPFTYGNEETGDFYGTITTGQVTGNISGTYRISADGYGTLILPGNVKIYNTLRVKSEKNYSQNMSSANQNIKIETYRWYSESNRYPLLVLTEVTTTMTSTSKSYQAAYNNNIKMPSAIKDSKMHLVEDDFTVLPNPAKDIFNVSVSARNDSKIVYEFFDLSGKNINTVLDEHISGTYTKEMNAVELGLGKGIYILKTTVGEKSYQKQIVITQ